MTLAYSAPTPQQLALALDNASQALAQCADDFERLRIRDQAKAVEAAAKILDKREIQAHASVLVADAERAIVQSNPVRYGNELGRGHPLPDGLDRSMLSRFRAAHLSLPDTQYQSLREIAIRNAEPLTRKILASAAVAQRNQEAPPLVRLSAITWTGGKAVNGSGPTLPAHQWIRSFIPWRQNSIYVEPFAGMLGILLSRPPVRSELVNDLNHRIINWWRCIRDETTEMERLIALTPWAREEYEWARDNADNMALPPTRRALAFHILATQDLMHRETFDRSDSTSWVRAREGILHRITPFIYHDKIRRLATRMHNVQIENNDATKILGWIADSTDAVIYADPPYHSASQNLYAFQQIDTDAISKALIAQQGTVILSGQDGEWPMLEEAGWEKHNYDTIRQTPMRNNQHSKPRIETVWLNRPLEQAA